MDDNNSVELTLNNELLSIQDINKWKEFKEFAEKELSKFHNEVIKPKLEKAWLDFVLFGYGKEEIILLNGTKQIIELKHPERYYQKSPYKSPAEMMQLPDLKEIEKLTKDLLIHSQKEEDKDKKVVNISDYRF